ncbi:MAG: right-handed parallel beta-helix repeat-containing protein [Dehalococcoidia bacterium]|nr:right-handed parallel beta-helix repeat-containing protein [Dehalococcoidia bacterium]
MKNPISVLLAFAGIIVLLAVTPLLMALASEATYTDIRNEMIRQGYVALADQDGNLDVAGDMEVDGDALVNGDIVGASVTAPTGRSATYVIAALDTPAHAKAQADFVCDGIDDQIEINAYLLLGNVQLLEGNFSTSGAITIPSDTHLTGSGIGITSITGSGTGTHYQILTNSDWVVGNNHIVISNLTADANWTTGSTGKGGVVHLVKVTDSAIDKLEVANGYSHNIATVRCQIVYIQNCVSRDPQGDDGFSVSDGSSEPGGSAGTAETDGVWVVNCNSSGVTGASSSAFEVDDGPTNVWFVNNYAFNLGTREGFNAHVHTGEVCPTDIHFISNTVDGGVRGINVARDYVPVAEDAYLSDILISSNNISGTTDGAICITAARSVTIENNIVDGDQIKIIDKLLGGTRYFPKDVDILQNTITASDAAPIDAWNSDSVNINGNRIIGGTAGQGIRVEANNRSIVDILIRDNTIRNMDYDGVFIETKTGFTLTGLSIVANRIYDDQEVKTQNWSMRFLDADGGSITQALITDNDFAGSVGSISGAVATMEILDNIGYVTSNSGTATVASGGTSIVVNHGLVTTPTRVQITPRENPTNAVSFWWVDTLTTTQFTIHVNADPGASNLDFDWRAVIGEGI